MLLMLFSTQISFGQKSCCALPAVNRSFKNQSNPILVDTDLFYKQIIDNAKLEKIYRSLAKEQLSMAYYAYFIVSDNGTAKYVRSSSYKSFADINQLIKRHFVNYKWKAAHQLNKSQMQVSSDIELAVYFNTTENKVDILIRQLNVKDRTPILKHTIHVGNLPEKHRQH